MMRHTSHAAHPYNSRWLPCCRDESALCLGSELQLRACPPQQSRLTTGGPSRAIHFDSAHSDAKPLPPTRPSVASVRCPHHYTNREVRNSSQRFQSVALCREAPLEYPICP